MMSIRLVLNAIPTAPGGGLSVLLGMLEGWREIGVKLDIRVLTGKPSAAQALTQAGFGDNVTSLDLVNGIKAMLWQKHRLPFWLQRIKADLLLTNTFYVPGCPCPQVVHHQNLFTVVRKRTGLSLGSALRLGLLAKGARQALAKAQANVFLSQYMRDCAEAIDPASHSRGHVIYNGINGLYMRAASGSLGPYPRDSRVIFALQSAYVYKGNEVLFDVLAELVRLYPDQPWQLKIAGGSNWRVYKRLASNMGLGQRVQFLGHLDLNQVAQLYCSSLCLIYPSVFEGFGLPVVEAMAWGCPVIATQATAIPEIAGHAAQLVEANDCQAIVKAVGRLMTDENFSQGLRQRGKERARQFSWTTSAQKFYDVFEQVAGQSPSQAQA